MAAARQVLIKCGSAEMDGYAFCSGLSALKLPYESCPGLQSIVYTATYLIRGALFRPRRRPSQSGTFSLQIRPLSELVEMYHTRKATENHDKVYALLGMASDGNANGKLLADYNISWQQLFTQLIHSFLSKEHSVATWHGREVAIIRGKGYLLGEVSSVAADSTWEDKQIVHITWRNEWSGHSAKHERTSPWRIQSGAKAIQEGDLICLLQGAAKPTILRLLDDHIAIIRIAAQSDGEEFDRNVTGPKTSLLDFPLVWDWENSPKAGGYDKLFIASQVPEPSKLDKHLEKTARLESVRLVFQSTKRYDALAENLRTTIKVFERAFETVDKAAVPWCIHPDKSEDGRVSKMLASVDRFIRCNGVWETICIAATEGHNYVIKLLLYAGMVDLDREKHLRAPLWLATQHKRDDVSNLLLKAGAANWNLEGQTALFQAVENGNGMVVKLLLDSGIDQDSESMDGWRPVQLAAKCGNEVAIHWLLNKGGNLKSNDKQGNTLLGQAAQHGNKAVVELLLQKGANLESTTKAGNTPLGQAAYQGHKAVMELLLQKGANLESTGNNGYTPLGLAACYGHEAVVELLLQKGANLESTNNDGHTPLGLAAWYGHEAVVELLLQRGANLEPTNNNGHTPLGRAACQGHEAVVKLFLQKGAKLESTTKAGNTPLGLAAYQGYEAVVELLLQKGANLESTNQNGTTPIGRAAYQGHKAVVELLLQKGANLESTDNHNYTPLGHATCQGHKAVVELLLQKGANLESINNQGETPLLLAAWYGHKAVMELLVQKGANLESTNDNGHTPLRLAELRGHKAVVEMLRAWGQS